MGIAVVDRAVLGDRSGRHVDHRSEYVKTPRVRPMGVGIRLTALHKDGHQFQVEINLAPYQSPDGLVVVSAIRDVAAQRGEQTGDE